MPTAADVGIPERFRSTVEGSVVLQSGSTTVLRMERQGRRELGTGKAFDGTVTSVGDSMWLVDGPGKVVNQGRDSATIEGVGDGQGYIQATRWIYFQKDGQDSQGLLIQTWILVVNASGRVETGDADVDSILPDSKIAPDIPRAVIKGRAVMRGTDQGVAGAYIELIGDRSGTLRANWETGSDGYFNITAANMLSVDRYEVFVRKGSANVGRADSFNEDLWPIRKYMVSVNHDNCRNLDVGRIEMAAVGDLWGDTGKPADRAEVNRTPASGDGTGTSTVTPGQIPSPGSVSPWDAIINSGVPIITTGGGNDGVNVDEQDLSAPSARVLNVDYKGYAEVDFHLKATMSLKFQGADVTGELYAPMISGQNVRLPGARMRLQGQLAGEWEDGGRITGDCTGHILWPGGQPEEREGQFNIRKVGNEIHFQSTKFYYNRYIFGAQGVKHTGGPGRTPSGKVANSVVILIDASGSMSGSKMDSAKATAKQRIAALDTDTELAVIAFSGNAVKFAFALMDAEGRVGAQAAVDGITSGGGTPLAAAIRDAGKYMRGNAGGRRLTLIVLSDGEETAGGNPPAEVRRLNDMSVSW